MFPEFYNKLKNVIPSILDENMIFETETNTKWYYSRGMRKKYKVLTKLTQQRLIFLEKPAGPW